MIDADFVFLGNQELNGILRGRSVPFSRREEALANGLPWVPANITIGALGTIPSDNPFGPVGEIRLKPDRAAALTFSATPEAPVFELVLCDYAQIDGELWPFCPRTALKQAVAALSAKGLTMKVAFEHEFTVHGLNQSTHVAFSLSAGCAIAPLAEKVLNTLEGAGISLEQFQAEFGQSQFEISSIPTDPLTAADRTVLTLEAIRRIATGMELQACFLPKPAQNVAGNGVHIHFSLWRGGRNVTYDGNWLTEQSAPFVAGLLDEAEALIPLTVLSANSYQRIRPHSWVGAFTGIGLRNRETMLRLVPRSPAADGSFPGASIEYRVSDATANVYLVLASIIRAGLAGVKMSKPAPPNVLHDPAAMNEDERAQWGLRPLPQTLEDALTQAAEARAAEWLGGSLAAAYHGCRRNDLLEASSMSSDQLAQLLSRVY